MLIIQGLFSGEPGAFHAFKNERFGLCGVEPGGVATGGGEPGGVATGGGEPGGVEPEGVELGGAASEGVESGGAEPQGAASSGGSAGASSRFVVVLEVCFVVGLRGVEV
ncbi:unnamed protein product [Closterium sp. NIES-53]